MNMNKKFFRLTKILSDLHFSLFLNRKYQKPKLSGQSIIERVLKAQVKIDGGGWDSLIRVSWGGRGSWEACGGIYVRGGEVLVGVGGC